MWLYRLRCCFKANSQNKSAGQESPVRLPSTFSSQAPRLLPWLRSGLFYSRNAMLSSQSKESLMYECMCAAARCMADGGTEAQAIVRSVAIVKATLSADLACPGNIAEYAAMLLGIKNSA
jgi:hypothetical protein